MDAPFEVWDPKSRAMLTCTFVDAGHCPGAVIIIFEGFANGRGPVIHTGDFRYYNELMENQTLQRVANLSSADIATRCQLIFFDSTCAHEQLCKLPAKEHSIRQLLGLLDQFSRDTIFLHSHGLGDEELLSAVATGVQGLGKLQFACKDRYEEVKIWDPSFCHRFCELLAP